MKYKVSAGQTVSSAKHERDFREGEIIDLSHASGADIAILLSAGVIVEIQEVQKEEAKKDVKHG